MGWGQGLHAGRIAQTFALVKSCMGQWSAGFVKVGRREGGRPYEWLQLSPSIIAPVMYALRKTPRPADPPKISDGHNTRSSSAPADTRAKKTMAATAIASTMEPETTFSRFEMKRVRLKCWTLVPWLVRRVSCLYSRCDMRRRGGVNDLDGTRREYRALNSASVCRPFRWLHGRQITWRLPSSLVPPLTAGITWSMSKLGAVRRNPQ